MKFVSLINNYSIGKYHKKQGDDNYIPSFSVLLQQINYTHSPSNLYSLSRVAVRLLRFPEWRKCLPEIFSYLVLFIIGINYEV